MHNALIMFPSTKCTGHIINCRETDKRVDISVFPCNTAQLQLCTFFNSQLMFHLADYFLMHLLHHVLV